MLSAAIGPVVGHCAAARGVEIPIFVFAGQSNAVGYGTDSTQLTSQQLASQANVLYDGPQDFAVNWQHMQPPTELNSNTIQSGHGFGPEASAPLTISNANGGQLVAAVKYAVNDTGLDSTWSPTWSSTNAQSLYAAMKSRVTTAKNSLTGSPLVPAGSTSRVAGFFWMQGERDTLDEGTADRYQYNLTQFIAKVRTDFGDANLPFILGQIGPSYGPYSDGVRRAEAAVGRLIARTAFVPTDNLPKNSDGVHFTTQGTWDLGVAFGNAYQGIVNSTPVAPIVNSVSNRAVNAGFEDYQIARFKAITRSGNANVSAVPTDIITGWGALGSGCTLVAKGGLDSFAGTSGTAAPSASGGSQFLALRNGSSGFGGASASFSVTSGEAYRIAFDYSAISSGNGATWGFTYDVNGISPATINVPTSGTNNFFTVPWQNRSFDFVSTFTSTASVQFKALQAGDNSFYGPAIDNLVIIAGRQWYGTSSDWGTANNWIGGTPNAPDAQANFLDRITAPTTINAPGVFAVGSMKFDNLNSYTIGGAGTINLEVSTGSGTIAVVRGAHAITAPLALKDPTATDVAAGATLSISGALSSASLITKTGGGALNVTATITAAPVLPSLSVNGGTLNFAASQQFDALSVNGGATMNMPAAGGPPKRLVARTLSIATDGAAPHGLLQLNSASAIVDYDSASASPIDSIRQFLKAGFDSNGTEGLASAAVDATHRLAYGEASAIGVSSFAGMTLDSSAVVIGIGLVGDTTLDGKVDIIDLGRLASHWQSAGVWTDGDFNYDGHVDIQDLGDLAGQWQAGVASPSSMSFEAALGALGLPNVSVPEPSALVLAGASLASFAMRPRRRRRPHQR